MKLWTYFKFIYSANTCQLLENKHFLQFIYLFLNRHILQKNSCVQNAGQMNLQ